MHLNVHFIFAAKTGLQVYLLDTCVTSELEKDAYKASVIGGAARVVTAEAGVGTDWYEFATSRKDVFCINRFGESGPAKKVAQHLGFTAEKLAELING